MHECWEKNRWRMGIVRCNEAINSRDMKEMLKFLEGKHPFSREKDVLWNLHRTKLFSVWSIYGLINDGGLRQANAKRLWTTKYPLKVRIFLWFCARKALLTWDSLQKDDGRSLVCEYSVDWRRSLSGISWSFVSFRDKCSGNSATHPHHPLPLKSCMTARMPLYALLVRMIGI